MRSAILIALVLLAGCNKAEEDQPQETSQSQAKSSFSYVTDAQDVIQDNETGCQYIYFDGKVAARLDSSGRPMCNQPSEGEDNDP